MLLRGLVTSGVQRKVAFPRSLPGLRDNPRNPYPIQVGSIGIFFLQLRNRQGFFRKDAQSLNDDLWDVADAKLAPIGWTGHSFIALDSDSHKEGLSPLVAMADIFARNSVVARNEGYRRSYLYYLDDLTPDQVHAWGIGNVIDVPGEDVAAAKQWLHDDLPRIWTARTPEDKLNLDGIRVYWGDRELLDRFLDEYLALPPTALCVQVPLLDSADRNIRIMPRMHGAALRGCIIGLSSPFYSKERAKILSAIIQYAGKDIVFVDRAIAEAAGRMFDRKDWSAAAVGPADTRPTAVLDDIRHFSDALSAANAIRP